MDMANRIKPRRCVLSKDSSLIDKFLGAFLGMAIGDALGAPLEFKRPGEFEEVTGFTEGGIHHIPKGCWTDDTSMALCLAESLIECNGFDPEDQMKRYVRWWKEGYLSPVGFCFDIGTTVSMALSTFQSTGEPYAGSTDPYSAGNGSLMRLAPVPLYYHRDPQKAIEMSGESSKTTHGADTCIDACRYFGGLIAGAVMGVDKATLLSPGWRPDGRTWQQNELHPEIWEIAQGSFKTKSPPQIEGSGYVVRSLEAALWAFYKGGDLEESVLLAVNLGEDADTTGAVCGQLAGAYYGKKGIPKRLINGLYERLIVEYMAERLYRVS